MARFPMATAIAALAILVLAPVCASAQSTSILDRVKERAQSRAQSQTENKANEQVDSTVDKTVDCMFNPVECAKKTPAATPAPTPAPAPTEGEAAPAQVANKTEWYAENQGKRVGPMPREQLSTMVTSGQVTATTLVWREGLGDWTAAGQVPELGDVFKKVPPPLPTRSGPPPLPSK